MSLFLFPDGALDGVVLSRHLTVAAAAAATGYNPQYLRRLLRQGRLRGVKIGRQWLIELDSLEDHLAWCVNSDDTRRGPQGLPAVEAAGVVDASPGDAIGILSRVYQQLLR